MRNVKKMLLGIAFLIIGSCGVPIWMAGAAVGAVISIVFLVIGIFLCIDGYLSTDE